MCGIVGYVGKAEAAPFLLDGLRRLEYRGYDSAGLSVIHDEQLQVRKCVGRVARLENLVAEQPVTGSLGISHTRWATHGLPSDANAHPHLDQSRNLALVHNGIIENFVQLRRRLTRRGHKFRSQTDTEVLAHLIGEFLDASLTRRKPLTAELLTDAISSATRRASGTYAIALIHQHLPRHIFAARRGSPLVLGLGKGENFLASDVSPMITRTRRVIYLQDGDVATLTEGGFSVMANGAPVRRPVSTANVSPEAAEKGRFPHYMLKEIHEQPGRMSDLLRSLPRDAATFRFERTALNPAKLRKIRRILLVACGTSWHAALTGEYLLETLTSLPVEVECASEFRYRDRLMEKGTLLISISQSGETADTLAAVRKAKAQGATTLAIVNVAGSTIARESDVDLQMLAGPEIGVSSTKAFTMQLLWLTLLGAAVGRQNGRLSREAGKAILNELKHIPRKITSVLRRIARIRAVARKYQHHTDFLFLGRQFNFPIALEGALKLKEISYIHADAYPSAEMKHGPIALISPDFPSVFIAPRDSMYEKNMSNIQEIRARNGPVIAIATDGDTQIRRSVDDVLFIPRTMDCLQPLLTVVPLQLLAYYIAVLRGCDVDKPRNLAKSVTVE